MVALLLAACRRGDPPAPLAAIAALDASPDCRALAACTVLGRCVAQNDECAATEADCRASTTCQSIGVCTARNGSCEVGSDADCRSSQLCRERGWCTRIDEMTCGAREDGSLSGSSSAR